MTKIYYSEETKTAKKVKLSGYFDSIITALESISGVNVSDDWKCNIATDLDSNLSSLIEIIPSIKSSLQSFDDFLGVTDATYSDVSDEISSTLKNFNS